MKYTIDHIPLTTPYNRRPGLKMEPEYITIHSTGNPNSTARNERVWLTNPQNDRTASYHVVVDEKEAIEVIPLNEVAWHAGDGNGFQPTYEELKLVKANQHPINVIGFQPTYEELKQITSWISSGDSLLFSAYL